MSTTQKQKCAIDPLEEFSDVQLDFLDRINVIYQILESKGLADDEMDEIMADLQDMFILFNNSFYDANQFAAQLEMMVHEKAFREICANVAKKSEIRTDYDLDLICGYTDADCASNCAEDSDGDAEDDDAPHSHLA